MTTDLRRRLLRDIACPEMLTGGRSVDKGVADVQATSAVPY